MQFYKKRSLCVFSCIACDSIIATIRLFIDGKELKPLIQQSIQVCDHSYCMNVRAIGYMGSQYRCNADVRCDAKVDFSSTSV